MHIIWFTTQFPVGEKNRNGMFIFRTVNELSKKYKITVFALHPVIPPLLPMLKNIKNAKLIYNEWREKFPRIPHKPSWMENLDVVYINYYRPPRPYLMFLESWGSYVNVKKILKKYLSEDLIIHANWIFPEGYLARIFSDKFNIPYILTLRGSDVISIHYSLFNKFFARKVILKASNITSVSSNLLFKVKDTFKFFNPELGTIVNNFYDFEKFNIEPRAKYRSILELPESKRIVFFAGALRKIKNIYLLLESVKELQEKSDNILLILAGYGYEENNLKKYVTENKMHNYVIFIGNIDSNKLIQYYNVCDLLCLPSYSEGFPNVVVEALMCGTPVVGSAVGGIPKIIKNEINGYLIDPSSKESLVEALQKTLNTNWDRKKLRESVAFLRPENVMKQYDKIYNEILKTKLEIK